jgi:hypothetical protein
MRRHRAVTTFQPSFSRSSAASMRQVSPASGRRPAIPVPSPPRISAASNLASARSPSTVTRTATGTTAFQEPRSTW